MPRLRPAKINVGAHVLVRAAFHPAGNPRGGPQRAFPKITRHPERAPVSGASRGTLRLILIVILSGARDLLFWVLSTGYWVLPHRPDPAQPLRSRPAQQLHQYRFRLIIQG